MRTEMTLREDMDLLLKVGESARYMSQEVNKLLEIREWAIAQLPIAEGDSVVLKRDINAQGGWYHYREILVEGSTGVASRFYLHAGVWRCYFEPDICWSVSEYPKHTVTRYIKGKKCFMLNVDNFRVATERDLGLVLPEDAIEPRCKGTLV
jgi:hypothetical protein